MLAICDWDLLNDKVHWSECQWRDDPSAEPLDDWGRLVHPDDRQLMSNYLQDARRKGLSSVEFRLRRGAGRYERVFSRGAVLRNGEAPVRLISAISAAASTAPAAAAPSPLAEGSRQQLFAWELNLASGQRWFSDISKEFGLLKGREDSLWQHIHPQDRSLVATTLERAISRHGAYEVEFRSAPAGDEHYLYYSEKGAFYFNAEGLPERLVGITEDITSRKLAASAEQRSQHRLQLALQAARMGTFEADASSGGITWSSQSLLVFSERPATTMGCVADFFHCIDPRDLNAVKAMWTRAAAKGSTFETEFRLISDGRWIQMNGRGHLDADRKPLHMTGTVMNISGRKEAEQALRQSEARWRLAIETARLGTWDYDLSTHAFDLSERTAALFGWSEKTPANYGEFLAVLPPEDRVLVKERIDRAVQQREADVFSLEHRVACSSDRSFRWVVSHCRVLFDDRNLPCRVISSVRDATDAYQQRSRMEAESRALSRSNADLQKFVSVASHDLKEPLRTISLHAQLMQRHAGDQLAPSVKVSIECIVAITRRMHTLLTDLLSEAVRGTQNDFEPVSLEEILREVRENVSATMATVRAELTVGRLPMVWGDRTRLVQLFQNLVANSLKFGGSRKPSIFVDATRVEQRWEIRVRDNGVGIPPAERERVFRMFERLNATQEVRGSGIGLAVCQTIAEHHGGTIAVESSSDEGSVFVIVLPAVTLA